MADHITVKSALPTRPDGGNEVALWEVHEDHPDGEAFVAGPNPVQVGATSAVMEAISKKRLVEVKGKAAEPKP